MDDDTEEAIRLLREQRPNVTNKRQLEELMEQTREARRAWIDKSSPTISQILQRFPRFQDMPESVINFATFVYHFIILANLTQTLHLRCHYFLQSTACMSHVRIDN